MIELRADRARLTVLRREYVTSGTSRVYNVKFYFSDDWDRFEKYVVFKVGRRGEEGEESVPVLLPYNHVCTIPQEMLTEANVILYIGVYGIEKEYLPTNELLWSRTGYLADAEEGVGQPEEPDEPVIEPFDPQIRPTVWCKYDMIRQGVTPGDIDVTDAMVAFAKIQNEIMDQVRAAELMLEEIVGIRDDIQNLVNQVKEVSLHQPIPGDNGFWLIWDSEDETYVETGASWMGTPGPGLPAGGSFGQLLAKSSDVDYAATWVNPPSIAF